MSKALVKFIRLPLTKARLIAREVQEVNAGLAMASLRFMPNRSAKCITDVISSAIINGGFEVNEIVVKSCHVGTGAVLERFRPRTRGDTSRIRKPASHILVEVAKTEVRAETKKAVAKKTPVKETSAKKVTAEEEG